MDSKAEFYDNVIKQQPTITMSSDIITTFINAYINCFTAVSRGSDGIVTGQCNTVLFSPAKTDLSRIITNLSEIIINLKSDISELNTSIEAKLQQIGSERELNETNSGIVSNITTSNSGSKIMIDDYKTIYNTQYYKNVELFIGVILMVLLSAKIFRK